MLPDSPYLLQLVAGNPQTPSPPLTSQSTLARHSIPILMKGAVQICGQAAFALVANATAKNRLTTNRPASRDREAQMVTKLPPPHPLVMEHLRSTIYNLS
jgi:hypothetical protein